jgi:hypothetical protein
MVEMKVLLASVRAETSLIGTYSVLEVIYECMTAGKLRSRSPYSLTILSAAHVGEPSGWLRRY